MLQCPITYTTNIAIKLLRFYEEPNDVLVIYKYFFYFFFPDTSVDYVYGVCILSSFLFYHKFCFQSTYVKDSTFNAVTDNYYYSEYYYNVILCRSLWYIQIYSASFQTVLAYCVLVEMS